MVKSADKDITQGGRLLPLIEEFYSIQGEGYHSGEAAYFLRVGGCDIGCRWCDSKASWQADLHELAPAEKVIAHCREHQARSLVVTGGEPLLYPMDELCQQAHRSGIRTFLETSGAHPLSGQWDWICLSPKENAPPLDAIFKRADELKVIISESKDLGWAEENAEKVHGQCKLYLQPEWSRFQEIIPQITEYIKKNPQWKASLQIHKFMHIP